jgi:hypothetical protein
MKKQYVLLAVVLVLVGSMASQAWASGTKGTKAAAVDGKQKSSSTETPDALVKTILPAYLSIREALSADSIKDVDKNASLISNILKERITKAQKEKKSKEYIATLQSLVDNAGRLSEKDVPIKRVRSNFGTFSDLFVTWLRSNISAKEAGKYQVFYCSMANHNWIQKDGEEISNPFYGSSMSGCGERRAL